MIQTLAHLMHHVCTAFGDLEKAQGYDTWKESIARIGQGSRARPQIWAAISTPLFNIMHQEGFVAQFICALSHQHKILAELAFMDGLNSEQHDQHTSSGHREDAELPNDVARVTSGNQRQASTR